MKNRSYLRIIIEAFTIVLALLFGILLGDIMNKHHVFNDEHMTNWTAVLVIMCVVVIYVIIWAIVSIKKLDKKDNQ
ncbi:MAG: hypothetical protein KBS89_04635 [Bacteroidales bacterium]|nr:hypothetical protein [Candidatus Egerieousia equi]